MFNVYVEERRKSQKTQREVQEQILEHQREILRQNNTKHSVKYKHRIVNFLKKVANDQQLQKELPITQKRAQSATSQFSLRSRLKFQASTSDQERIEESQRENKLWDYSSKDEKKLKENNIRLRHKEKEVGPQFRFKPKLQVERIYDTVREQSTIQTKEKDKAKKDFEKQLKQILNQQDSFRSVDNSFGNYLFDHSYNKIMRPQTGFQLRSKLAFSKQMDQASQNKQKSGQYFVKPQTPISGFEVRSQVNRDGSSYRIRIRRNIAQQLESSQAEEVEEQRKPEPLSAKDLLFGIHRKTYFKGLTSLASQIGTLKLEEEEVRDLQPSADFIRL